MKKTYPIIILCFLLVFGGAVVGAQISAPDDSSPNWQLTLSFDALKEGILTRLDGCIVKISEIRTKVQINPKISEVTRGVVVNGLSRLKNGFISYRSIMEAVVTLEELRAANRAIISYLIENKDVIRENIRNAILDIGEGASEKAGEFKTKFKQILQLLKKTCSAEAETIFALETQLGLLENKINALKQAIQSQDTAAIKQGIRELGWLAQEIAGNIKQIQAKCL